jgi:hypothetical protein
MTKKDIVRLAEAARGMGQGIVKRLQGPSAKVKRAQMLRKADAEWPAGPEVKLAAAYACRVQTGETVRKRLVPEGVDGALERTKRATAPTPPKLDGVAAAKVSAMR